MKVETEWDQSVILRGFPVLAVSNFAALRAVKLSELVRTED